MMGTSVCGEIFQRNNTLHQTEDVAIATLLERDLEGVEVREVARHRFESHWITDFARYHNGIRIRGADIRVSYHRDGFIDWVSGMLKLSALPAFPSHRDWTFPGASVEPIYEVEEGRAFPAYEVLIRSPFRHRRLILSPSGRLLKELRIARVDPGVFWDAETIPVEEFSLQNYLFRAVKAYAVNPTVASHTAVSLSGLTSISQTLSGEFHLQRDQNINAVTAVDVSPTTDFTAVSGFSELPANFNHTCIGSSTECPNQGFDALNVYYHLSEYRIFLNSYLDEMGVKITLGRLPVIVNAMRLDFDGDGTATDETNNAAYYPQSCGTDASNQPITRCLIFLRPAAVTASLCGGAAQFFDLAREAVVVVHEYQHYVTDIITHMEPGSLSKPVVGDALHEGYSDYFAASFISQKAGSTVTKIGSYAFSQCPVFIRDVGTLRVYRNNTDLNDPTSDIDPHHSGLSWASGLWSLRQRLGVAVTDKIALRSLFFLSVKPSFLEAVEALVQADSVLGGKNSGVIREVFVNEIRFIGGSLDAFRDPATGVIETGLRGCAVAESGSSSSWLFVAWLFMTLGVGWVTRSFT